jgi:hypothetical protein
MEEITSGIMECKNHANVEVVSRLLGKRLDTASTALAVFFRERPSRRDHHRPLAP